MQSLMLFYGPNATNTVSLQVCLQYYNEIALLEPIRELFVRIISIY